MARNKPKRVIADFIEIYRSEPCLWLVKSPEYHDRAKKNVAYAKLAKKLEEIEPGADKTVVMNKINSLRSSHRKEKRKVEASKRSGASTDCIYKPALWYYDLFDFLPDQNTPRSSISNLDSDEESVDNLIDEGNADVGDSISKTAVDQEVATQNKRPIMSRPDYNKKQKINDDLSTEVIMTIRDHFKTPKEEPDRFDLIGKTVALKLRGLGKRQALIAEKKIGDVLFEAEMDCLSASPMYHHGSSASESPNIPPCPLPSSRYEEGSFASIKIEETELSYLSQNNTASSYSSQSNTDF